MLALDEPLQKVPISAGARAELLKIIGYPSVLQPQKQEDDVDWRAYLVYFSKQCRYALHNRGRHVCVRTYSDIFNIAKQLQDPTATRASIELTVGSTLAEPKPSNAEEVVECSIDLVARLMLMMDVGGLQYGYSGRPHLTWTAGSLEEFVHDYFDDAQILDHKNVRLEATFTARNLGRIAGIQVEWTDNLADHLRMTDENDRKVAIFHHASFLKQRQDRYVLVL